MLLGQWMVLLGCVMGYYWVLFLGLRLGRRPFLEVPYFLISCAVTSVLLLLTDQFPLMPLMHFFLYLGLGFIFIFTIHRLVLRRFAPSRLTSLAPQYVAHFLASLGALATYHIIF
jgi:hypothetical protein